MRVIPLTKGHVAIVDEEDYGRVSMMRWYAHSEGYAVNDGRKRGGSGMVLMHRFILNAPVGIDVDHVDGDGFDNRRVNLRMATRSQNNMNSRKRDRCTSRFKGVSWGKRDRKWVAQIKKDGVHYNLGYFSEELLAAKAYDRAAKMMFKEYARLNFPEEDRRQYESKSDPAHMSGC
ncbi:MAG: HNH endonuclease [Deltaproteobacteria bacterium]|nr:HNH endonuclease [Deltaproteobacteria bacterium]